jgi:hypothetical protein
MRNPLAITMKIIALLIGLNALAVQSFAQHAGHSMPHEMQHGFILAADDKFASHLVANGHHSRQVEITGQLLIDDLQEMEIYQDRKLQSAGSTYFLFQAQDLDLPSLSDGQVLVGHIVESKMGDYEPKNKIVRSATFQVHKVLLNIPNPFFAEIEQQSPSNLFKKEKKNCCDTGYKACNVKC